MTWRDATVWTGDAQEAVRMGWHGVRRMDGQSKNIRTSNVLRMKLLSRRVKETELDFDRRDTATNRWQVLRNVGSMKKNLVTHKVTQKVIRFFL